MTLRMNPLLQLLAFQQVGQDPERALADASILEVQ